MAPPTGIWRWWKAAAKLLLTAALLYLVWRMVEGELGAVAQTLRGASLSLLALTFLNHLFGRFLMAWQTGLSMRVYGARYSPLTLFAINLKTLFFAFFLPGDFGGSAVKWYLITRIDGRRAEALAAMIYIRMVNLLVVLLTGLGALLFRWPFSDRSGLVYLIMALAFVLAVMVALHLRLTQRWWDRLLTAKAVSRLGAGVIGRLNKVHDAFMAVSTYSARDLAVLWGFSVAVKLSITLSFWLAARALGLEVGLVSLLWIHSAVEIVQFLPISIGGLGTREITAIYLLGLFGIAEPAALGFSLVLFSLRLGMVALGGLLAGWDALRGGSRDG